VWLRADFQKRSYQFLHVESTGSFSHCRRPWAQQQLSGSGYRRICQVHFPPQVSAIRSFALKEKREREMAAYMDELVDSSGESQVVGETRGIRGLETQMESLAAMVRQESEHYPPVGDYLELLRNFPSSEPDPVSENWRRQLCEWCYDGTCVQQGCWLPTDFRAVLDVWCSADHVSDF
jgi:hypothetical protein